MASFQEWIRKREQDYKEDGTASCNVAGVPKLLGAVEEPEEEEPKKMKRKMKKK